MSSPATVVAERPPVARLRLAAVPWEWGVLTVILVFSAILNFVQLSKVGLGNTYYAAAVKSMMQSWHNFFFVSFDPGGFVSIDKPPLAFWLQTASAKLFGFSGTSLLLPEALAGVLSVWLMYALVARIFGRPAGLLSALALAISPVMVLVARSNLVESILVLTFLLAAWAASRAVERSSLRWMLLAAVFLGLGFNVKSLEAYLAAPAVFLFYFVGARVRWPARIWHLLLAGVVMLAVSLSWMTAVDATPASQRPYVASSGNNSELNLALGYNGLGRLTGNQFSFVTGGSLSSTLSDLSATNLGFTAGEAGSPGIGRLVNAQLGGQASWLILLAIIGVLAVLWQRRPRWPLDHQGSATVFWGGWLLTVGGYVSIAGTIHAYYLATLAPPVAALSGIALVVLWRQYRAPGWRGWLLPLALVATALVQADILRSFPAWNGWMTPLVVGSTLVLAVGLTLLRLGVVGRRLRGPSLRVTTLGAATLATVVLLLSPFIWSEYTVAHAAPSLGSSAGPAGTGGYGGFGRRGGHGFNLDALRRRFGGEFSGRPFAAGDVPDNAAFWRSAGRGGGFGDSSTADPALVHYLQAHQGRATFLVATLTASTAEPFILSTGKPVMDLGGFMGGDHILSASQLAGRVTKGVVRYFLMTGGGPDRAQAPQHSNAGASSTSQRLRGVGGFGRTGANNDLVQWVTAHCSVVPHSAYGATTTSSVGAGGAGQLLYDCAAASRQAG